MVEAKLNAPSRWLLPYLLLTAIMCGALIMVIEVLGSRVIGPFFGVSLFVWTSLITVTLIALALGYAFGGLLADRFESADAMYALILLAGLCALAIPWLRAPILEWAMPLGLRLGALTSAAILFGPSLFLLGCVSPYLVKIATRQMRHIGRTVGGFYALSTIGSVGGTALTGFVLIGWLGVGRIFTLTGTLLVGLAVFYFALIRRKWPFAAVIPVLFLLGHWGSGKPTTIESSSGLTVSVIDEIESQYGNLKIVDSVYRDLYIRELLLDGWTQGGIDMTTGFSTYAYSYYLQFIPYALHPAGERCMVLGFGAGIIPGWYERQGIATDAVDIDPAVEQLARQYFNYDGARPVIIQDARQALMSGSEQYDYLILDVASGDRMPGHLFSLEAFDLYARSLTPRGVLGINLIGSMKEDSFMTASVVKTLAERFDQVEIYPAPDLSDATGIGNLVIAAYMGPVREVDWQAMQRFPISPGLEDRFWKRIGQRFEFPEGTPAIILTDDYNPYDLYNAPLHEKLREQLIESTRWKLLL